MTSLPSYRDVLARLVVARRFGMKLGLERMRELLDRLGGPDRHLGRVVHVGGTNGKGSTVAMLAALARSGGARVATYTSPHLSTLRERIVIDGAMVTERDVVDAYQQVAAAGGDELTFFEQVTAIAFVLIARAGVDISVIEVGLGGRLDATNVVDPTVACITGVAMDHEAILGDSLEAIAYEKAGICKAGRPIAIGRAGEPDGIPMLVAHATAAGAQPIIVVDDDDHAGEVSLAGAHQRHNASAAVAVMRVAGLAFDPAALAHVVHPGRFEIAGDLILDGAHNPHGARALAATLREKGLRPVLVLAVSADKDVRALGGALVPVVRAVIATRYQQERALAPQVLADVLREVGAQHVEAADDLGAAVTRARELGGPVLIAGSLFVVGEARSRYLGAPTDPFVATEAVTTVT
jgi:dihydrofolate synthase/folylpolyglutamate synthase